MIFHSFLKNRVTKRIQEQNTNILNSLNLQNPDIIQLNGKKFQLYLKKREIEFLLEYFFAKHLNQMVARFGEEVISSNLVFIPILKGGVYLESTIKVFSRLHFVSSEFVGMQSYDGEKKKENRFYLNCSKEKVENKHLILIDEIIDTGDTLKVVTESLFEKNPASINFFIAINKLDLEKKHSLETFFKQYGIYTTAIDFPNDYWAIGTLLGLDTDQFCRATLDNLYIEKKTEPPNLDMVNFYTNLELLITEFLKEKCTKEELAHSIETYLSKPRSLLKQY